MKFPRGRILRFPSKHNPRKNFDPERLSFLAVIALFSVFTVIFLVELYYKEGHANTNNYANNNLEFEYQAN